MVKFNRNYELTVTFENGTSVLIRPPLTLDLDIIRNTLTSANTCSIRVYNLSEKNRNLIRKDVFDYGLRMQLQLKAGYGKNLPIIFEGTVSAAWSVREGVDYITTCECFDGGYAFTNAISSAQIPAGTSQRDGIVSLIDGLKVFGVQPGAIGAIDGTYTRGAAFVGNTIDLLNQLTNGNFFIDNGKANVLSENEYIDGDVPFITATSGLLGTPVRQNTFLTFDMIFEPRLLIGQKIRLGSQTNKNFNGFYKVNSIHHRGRISEGAGGSVITTVGMWAPKELTAVKR